MTLDGFLTFLTLILAALAITPPVVRLRLMLRWKSLAVISGICFALAIYLEFFNALALPCPSQLGQMCLWLTLPETTSVTPSQWAFVVVLIWLISIGIMMPRKSVAPSALPALAKLIAFLAYNKRWTELIQLAEPNLSLVVRAAKRELPLMQLHDRIRKLNDRHLSIEEMLDLLDAGKAPRSGVWGRAGSGLRHLAPKTSHFLPGYDRTENAAKDIVRILYRTPELTKYLALYNHEFAIQLLSFLNLPEVHDFFDLFMTTMISSPQSSLYAEIEQNQSLGQKGYTYPEHNRLLHFLFSPCTNAEDLAAYKPVGEHFLSNVRSENGMYVRYLNGPADMFHSDERWRDPSFVAVQFFQLMVTAAIWDGIEWHMWLYYYPHFSEALVSIYDQSGSDIDEFAEYPTRAAYLLDEMINNLLGWISTVENLPDSSPHKKVASTFATHENNNIPKSAALALGMCLPHIILSGKISERVKSSIHGNVMRKMRDLTGQSSQDIRAVLIRSIINRGPLSADAAYGQRLLNLFSKTDPIVQLELKDYEAALHAEYDS